MVHKKLFYNSQLFADDIAFHTANPSLSNVVSTLNNDRDKLDQYLSRKGLLLNPSKTGFMVLRKPCHQLSEHYRLTCRGITISCCEQAKYLGMTIDEHLTFAPHVKEVCAKAYGKVSTFKHGRRNLSKMARRLFYLSIVQSTLEFASSAYVHCLTSTLFQKLIVCSHLCMKKIFNLDRLAPTSVVLKHGSRRVHRVQKRWFPKIFDRHFAISYLHIQQYYTLKESFKSYGCQSHRAIKTNVVQRHFPDTG